MMTYISINTIPIVCAARAITTSSAKYPRPNFVKLLLITSVAIYVTLLSIILSDTSEKTSIKSLTYCQAPFLCLFIGVIVFSDEICRIIGEASPGKWLLYPKRLFRRSNNDNTNTV